MSLDLLGPVRNDARAGLHFGAHVALVVDIADPDGEGRVRVKLPSAPDGGDDAYEAWARLATFMAGADRGSWFVPDPGDEVLVVFEGGDPRRPYVIGSLWNGSDSPPASMDGSGDNNLKVLRSRNGVRLLMDDTDGSEQLLIETPGGHRVTLSDADRSVLVEDAAGNSVKLETAGITLTSSGTVKVQASTVDVSAGSVKVTAGMSTFSGVVKADTVIANTVVGTSYTPGAGEHLVSALDERVDWLTAPALWPETAQGAAVLDRPELLRFAGDDFMDQFTARVGESSALASTVAANETWRAPATGLAAVGSTGPVKLYQPAHGRFYLVAAGLVCSSYGLPDKTVGAQDRTGFVVRRLVPTGNAAVDPLGPSSHAEFGWVPSGDAGTWVLAPSNGLVRGEEQLGLFPTVVERNGRRRRTLAGLLPVGARERYEGARLVTASAGGASSPAPSAANVLAEGDVIVGGLQAIHRALDKVDASRAVRHGLYFLLLDLDAWLSGTPGLRAALSDSTLAKAFRSGQTWFAAAAAATESYASVATLGPDDEAPTPVSGMSKGAIVDAIAAVGVTSGSGASTVPTAETQLHKVLSAGVAAAMTGSSSGTPAAGSGARHVYVVRCTLERPNCRPSHRLVVSRPTRPFVMAGFHDPDAPARAVVIPTPVDVTVGGLRKFPRNVKVAISKQLKVQMDRVRGVTLDDLDSGDIPAAGGVSFGLICSLSIPIITICALMLLMIIVQLLNIVFFWVPLFQICRPESE